MEKKMIGNLDKGKAICLAYRNGMTISQISKAFNSTHTEINRFLKRYFGYFYDEEYKTFSEKRNNRLEEIYEKYQEVYVRGLYTRSQMCEILGGNVNEFEAMSIKYGLNNQWLQTYSNQKTLCNVPEEFIKSVKDFVDKYGFKSVRAVAVTAINEFMLQQMLLNGDEDVREEKPIDEYISIKQKHIQELYYESHKDEIKKWRKIYYKNNSEKMREQQKQYYWANAEKCREQKRKKYWEDVEKSRDYGRLKTQRKKERLLQAQNKSEV